ncbi:MAG: hypothetical protein AABZ15_15645 [Nitrospirota bacterium]
MEKQELGEGTPSSNYLERDTAPDQQELLHLQVVAVVFATFLIDMVSPPFIVS